MLPKLIIFEQQPTTKQNESNGNSSIIALLSVNHPDHGAPENQTDKYNYILSGI